MKMKKRRARSRARKVVRKKVAVAKRRMRVVKKVRKAARKVKRRSRISRKLADEHVRNLILQIAGEKALAVAEALEEPLSDEDLASACKIKLSEVRAVLNKLHSYGLTAYERSRDKESGWYSYVWRLSLNKADKLLQRKEVPASTVSEETVEFYTCKSCKKGEGVMIPFDVAFENKFKCLDCGAPLVFVEKKNTK
ncbi:MAG: hypothetical protein QXF56_02855 [Candidatus Micrarchaeia archaeon]